MPTKRRTKVLGIKVRPETFEEQQRLAAAAGQTVSEYLRARLGLECEEVRIER